MSLQHWGQKGKFLSIIKGLRGFKGGGAYLRTYTTRVVVLPPQGGPFVRKL